MAAAIGVDIHDPMLLEGESNVNEPSTSVITVRKRELIYQSVDFIAVRYTNGIWKYNENDDWLQFIPQGE